VLDKALELDELNGSKKVDLNLIKRSRKADGATTRRKREVIIVIYIQERDRIKINRLIKSTSQRSIIKAHNRFKIKQITSKNRAVKVSEEMTGYCNVDGSICKFPADTGAQRTVIDVSVLGKTNNYLFKIILVDKSEETVLGVKKSSLTLACYSVQVEEIISKNVSHNCLLGLDF
jgi:hypothetical protein